MSPVHPPLYSRVLGRTGESLPAAIRSMHEGSGPTVASGLACVERGGGFIARLIAAIVGFPKAGDGIPVSVSFTPDEHGELWQRTFAGRRFSSYQFDDPTSDEPIVFERFGPVTIALHLVIEGDRLNVVPLRWWALGIPLPEALMPIGETYEWVDAHDRFNFHVEIAHPWFGLVVRYRGYLIPA